MAASVQTQLGPPSYQHTDVSNLDPFNIQILEDILDPIMRES